MGGEVETGVVGFEADAVAETVGEGAAVSGVGDDVAGDAVDFVIGDSRRDGIDGRLPGGVYDVVDLNHFGSGPSKADGAGHVGGVALMNDAEVDDEKVAGSGDGLIRKVVDLPAIRAGGDDGDEGIAVDFFANRHLGENEPLDSPLGHARLDFGENGIEDDFIDALGFLHDGDLGR